MEKSSPSPTLPGSPTPSTPESFSAGASLLAFFGLLGLIAVIFVVSFVGFIATHHGAPRPTNPELIHFGIALQGLIDVAIVIYLVAILPRLSKTSFRGLGFRAPSASEIGVALVGALAMIVIVNGLGSIIDTALHTKHQQEPVKMLLTTHDPAVKVALAFLAVIVAPVSEELAFRVFIFNAVRKYRGFWWGAVVSGILFGAAHTDVYALVPLILGGMILCWVYATSRNAWMSMITHGLFNGVSVFALFFAPQLTR